MPVAVITGDQYVGPEAAPFCPGIEAVEVKRSVSRYAAQHLHPDVARERIRAGVHQCADRARAEPGIAPAGDARGASCSPPTWPSRRPGSATYERVDPHAPSRFTDDDPLRLFRTFMTLVFLTRALVETR